MCWWRLARVSWLTPHSQLLIINSSKWSSGTLKTAPITSLLSAAANTTNQLMAWSLSLLLLTAVKSLFSAVLNLAPSFNYRRSSEHGLQLISAFLFLVPFWFRLYFAWVFSSIFVSSQSFKLRCLTTFSTFWSLWFCHRKVKHLPLFSAVLFLGPVVRHWLKWISAGGAK